MYFKKVGFKLPSIYPRKVDFLVILPPLPNFCIMLIVSFSQTLLLDYFVMFYYFVWQAQTEVTTPSYTLLGFPQHKEARHCVPV